MSLSTSLKIASAGSFVAAAAIMFSLSGHAVAGVAGKYCQAVSREGAIKCCEQGIRNSSVRVTQAGGRCVSVVVCRRGNYAGAHANYRCWVPQSRIAYLKPVKRLKPIVDSHDPQQSRDPRGNQQGRGAAGLN